MRIHTGAAAAQLAHNVSARAYTIGRNIVVGEDLPSFDSTAGIQLLAHELTHVVQQNGIVGAPSNEPLGAIGTPRVQRQCSPSPFGPPGPVPIGGAGFVWQAAELCMQQQYRAARPGVVGTNVDWQIVPTIPGSPEQLDQAAFRMHLVGASGMYLAQPDIIDFTWAEISDVTTENQFRDHAVRVRALAGEATAIAATPPPAGSGSLRLWAPGTWVPPVPWYWMGGDQWIRVRSAQGILAYTAFRDFGKEVFEFILLALLVKAMKERLKLKANPVVARAYAAAFIAVAVMTNADIALAGEEDPIESMFTAMKMRGLEIPDEVKQAILSDPALKERLQRAAREKGTPSDKAKQVANEMLKTIATNRDQFSREDLEALVKFTELQDVSTVPDAAPTVEALKDQLRRIQSGEVPDPGAPAGPPAPPGAPGGRGPSGPGVGGGRTPAPVTPAPQVTPTVPGRPAPTVPSLPTPTPADAQAQAALAKQYPRLSPATIQRLAAAPDRTRKLLADLLSASPTPIVADDRFVNRYLDITKGLTPDQYDAVSGQLVEIGPGATADQVLDSIAKAVAAPASTKAGTESGVPSKRAKEPRPKRIDPERVRRDAMDILRKFGPDLAKLPRGAVRLYWKPPIKQGDKVDAVLAGKSPEDAVYIGLVHVLFEEVNPGRVRVEVLDATDFYDRDGNVIYTSADAVGQRYPFDVQAGAPLPPR